METTKSINIIIIDLNSENKKVGKKNSPRNVEDLFFVHMYFFRVTFERAILERIHNRAVFSFLCEQNRERCEICVRRYIGKDDFYLHVNCVNSVF